MLGARERLLLRISAAENYQRRRAAEGALAAMSGPRPSCMRVIFAHREEPAPSKRQSVGYLYAFHVQDQVA
jgi:hypothetical protein